MHLVRTTFAYEEISNHLAIVGRNPLVEIYLVQFLLVALYAEMEEKIKDIILARLKLIQDQRVAEFIFKTNESMLKRVKKAEINDVLQKFGCGEGDVIAERLPEINLQPYFDAITNRHRVSHDDGASMTLEDFGKALPCAEHILDAVEQALTE
ncbi:hypothetical protein LZK98_16350 [Sphingomonas cannabina]|uniref:HEPN domain-containing protein n=1 Tax=Sphingomonas cannabina TaxID=2899123 RepID=UPI001F1DF3B9|nr:HEPN domain-containing protein [Sphingomonas cannabina]UIJ44615.1 hypothetical protein LZK98_16350 [Sphingomonas cannabina]